MTFLDAFGTMLAMRRESRRRVTVVAVALIAALALIAAACTNDEADSAPTAPADTTTTATSPATLSTVSPDPTPESVATTTTFILETVGSRETLSEQLEEARKLLKLAFDDEAAAALATPDLTSPNPLTALQQLLQFEVEAVQIGSVSTYAEILAVQGSPAYWSLRRRLDTFVTGGLTVAMKGDYLIHSVELVDRAVIAAIAGSEVMAAVPEGAAFVAYETSSDPYDILNEDGSILQREEGWEQRSRTAILARTESGWKYFWDES